MDETIEKLIQMVERLNNAYYDQTEDDELIPFEFSSVGNHNHLIKFLDLVIWHSEDDDREYIDEQDTYEPLEPHICKIANGILEQLGKVRF
jgi:hypothetical protein